MFNRSSTPLPNSCTSPALQNSSIDPDSQEDAVKNEEHNNSDIDGNAKHSSRNLLNLPQPPTDRVPAPSTISIATTTIIDHINSNLDSEAAFHIIPTLPEYINLQQRQQHEIQCEYQDQHQNQYDREHQQYPQFPEPDLLTLVQSYDWPRTLHRLQRHPSEATSVGVEGRTPLHIACDHDAPAFVIRSLLATDELLTSDSNNSSSAITMVGTSNMNPLHIACTSPHASACVVSELLLRSRPDLPTRRRSAIVKKITEMKDVDGDMPLHAACRCGAPIEVLALMLDANPSVVSERDYEGLTPLLRLWVRYFVILGEEVISRVEREEDLVGDLGEAWEKTTLLLRVSYYGNIVVDYGSGEDSNGSDGEDTSMLEEGSLNALNFTHKCHCAPSDIWTCGGYPTYVSTDDLQKGNEQINKYPTTAPTTTTTTTTAITNYNTNNTEQQNRQQNRQQTRPQPFLLVHAATKVDCPRQVVKIATKLYPDQLHKMDSNGYTPLALAARAPIFKEHDLSEEGYCIEDQIHGDDVPPVSFSDYDLSSNNERMQECQQQQSCQTTSPSVIQILLDASMEMVSHPHPRTGRIPLHYAILSGKTWFEGVRTILEAYPDGIMEVDSVTGLYPFMLAATVSTTSTSNTYTSDNYMDSTSTDRDAMSLGDGSGGGGMMEHADPTTIFCLLRRKPETLLWVSNIMME